MSVNLSASRSRFSEIVDPAPAAPVIGHRRPVGPAVTAPSAPVPGRAPIRLPPAAARVPCSARIPESVHFNGVPIPATGAYRRSNRQAEGPPVAEVSLVVIPRGRVPNREFLALLAPGQVHRADVAAPIRRDPRGT